MINVLEQNLPFPQKKKYLNNLNTVHENNFNVNPNCVIAAYLYI